MSDSVKVCRVCGAVLIIGMNITRRRYNHRVYTCEDCHNPNIIKKECKDLKAKERRETRKNDLINNPISGECRMCGSVLIIGINWAPSSAANRNYVCRCCASKDAMDRVKAKKQQPNDNRHINSSRSCRKCGVELTPGDNFYPSSQKKRDYICKSCIRKSLDVYRKEKGRKEEYKRYYAKHKWTECLRRIKNTWNNHEEYLEKTREYRTNNLDKIRAKAADWARNNRDKTHETYTLRRDARIDAYLKYRLERAALKQLLVITT